MYKIIGTDQKEYGPITSDQVRQWIAEGRLNGQSPTQAAGESGWKPLSMFPEFADILPKMGAPGSPQAPMPAVVPPASVPNYLVQAILCTLCCCLPFGIAAIVYASQVNGKLQAGDYEGALASSRNAKMWCWLSLGFGLLVNAIFIVVQFLGAIIGSSHQQ
jgi:hypothetical protein